MSSTWIRLTDMSVEPTNCSLLPSLTYKTIEKDYNECWDKNIFKMRGEMQAPDQAPESGATREEWKTWCRKTCFTQKARVNNIIFCISYDLEKKRFCTCICFLWISDQKYRSFVLIDSQSITFKQISVKSIN